MEDLLLIFPNDNYIEEIADYRKEMLDNNSSMDGCGILRYTDNPSDWIKHSIRSTKKVILLEGLVVATQFICVRKSDLKIVGMIQVRHSLNRFLKEYGGHIGYSVRPSERKKDMQSGCLIQYCHFAKKLD